ncbi:hypothetical protein C3L33_02787, partial [Rhododendron williamsianum]
MGFADGFAGECLAGDEWWRRRRLGIIMVIHAPFIGLFYEDNASYPNRCDYYVITDGGDEMIAAQAEHQGTNHAIYQVCYDPFDEFVMLWICTCAGQIALLYPSPRRRPTISKLFKFDPIKELSVSREMARWYMMDMITYADTGVVVVGAGSAGLTSTIRTQMSRLCIKWFQELEGNYLLEQEKHKDLLESMEKKCTDMGDD